MPAKHRLFVLTDIENEPDDTQSLVRLLLYSNEIDIEGLVAVTSTWMRDQVRPETIRDVIDGYAQVRDNLLRVDPDYPTPESLLKLVGEGAPLYGMAGVGEGHDSTGSEALIRAIDREDPEGRPVHVALWGGANCLGQALWKVQQTRSPAEVDAFIKRLTVYGISDQDDAGPWIRRNFPMIPYAVSVHGENEYFGSTWIGFAGPAQNGLPGADSEITNEWAKEHIQRGPLGSKYPDSMYGREGDTPSYLNHIRNGLGDPCRPDYGGWGGRYKRIFDEGSLHYHDACDSVVASDGSTQRSSGATIWRWRDTTFRDFVARMRWTYEPDAAKLLLPPVVVVDGDGGGPEFVVRKAKCKDTLEIDASESYVPDLNGKKVSGRELQYKWFMYGEVESPLPIPADCPDFDMHGTSKSSKLRITMPDQTAFRPGLWHTLHENGRVYHLILEVTAPGEIPLTRYRRILLDVTPLDKA